MAMDSEQPDLPISAEERQLFQEKLLSFLAEQARRYTGGDSSSVPVETAQELLRSLCYHLNLSPDKPSDRWRTLLHADLKEEYQRSLHRFQERLAYGEQLWRAVRTRLPPVESRSMLDTLDEIGVFWRRYDPRFFAHQIPCGIDYQLALPMPDELAGVDYINRYLEHLAVENQLLSCFRNEALISVLERSSPDYQNLLVNLFEPVAANALGLTVLGQPAAPLLLSGQALERLSRALQNPSRRELTHMLCQAADRLSPAGTGLRNYLRGYARLLARRVAALRDYGSLSGVFLSHEA